MGSLKKIFCLFIFLVLIISVNSSALAMTGSQENSISYRGIKVTLNGKEFVLKDSAGNIIEPFIMNGSTYVPVRAVSELFGANVVWDDKTSTINLTYDAGGAGNTGDSGTAQFGDAAVPLAASPDSLTSADDNSQKLLQIAKSVFDLCNEERVKVQLPPYVWDDTLYEIAQVRAGEILTSFSHTRPDGSNVSALFDEKKLKYYSIGENIGIGYKAAETMVSSMMASQSHKDNILRDFEYSAVCVVECPDGSGHEGYAFAQIFMKGY
ncbi:MAG: stalk domain-containing protein [Oscillospiraceae bacterium]|nr:stalk domain-containing protein [Oscillospiraceae bacterium]